MELLNRDGIVIEIFARTEEHASDYRFSSSPQAAHCSIWRDGPMTIPNVDDKPMNQLSAHRELMDVLENVKGA